MKVMKLSKDFELKEFTLSKVALSKGLDNTPSEKHCKAIQSLVDNILQPARSFLGLAITVTSGYRSKDLNAAVGGANGSQHSKGEAADVVCNDNAKLFNYIANHCVYDQLIWEFGDDNQPDWVHVSYKAGGSNRMQKLRAVKGEKGAEYKTM